MKPVDWANWLDSEIEAAAGTMVEESGGLSSCTIHKDGRVTGGLKYREGRLVALAELRRMLREGRLNRRSLATVAARWQAEFDLRRAHEPSSPMWVAYATGGLEAVLEAAQVSNVEIDG